MKFSKILRLCLVLVFIALLTQPAQAQSYVYSVTRYEVNFLANSDGTASVEYYIDFKNSTSGPTIEFVDIGLPNNNYDLSSISADVNNQAVQVVKGDPQYISTGVTIELGAQSIQPGQSATVHLFVPVQRDMFYQTTSSTDVNEPYVSFNFIPNSFGGGVQGNSEYIVTLFLPAGIKESEPRYFTPKGWPGSSDPTNSGYTADNRVYYSWTSTDARTDASYTFGASFPARYLPSDVIQKEPSSNVSLNWNSDTFFSICCCGGFLAFMGLTIYGSIWGQKKRKLQYLPPKISIEGYGIKRGLTAVEAAVLMEQPLDKVLTMILFGSLKKGAAEVKTRDPLELTIPDQLPEGLNDYEIDFLNAFKIQEAAGRRKALQDMIVKLVKSLQEKMKGFNRKETIKFYQDIMQRAWQQVEEGQTPEVKSQVLEEGLDWMMLDDKYDRRTQEVFTQPIFVPTWWWRYDPTFSRPTSTYTPTSTVSVPSSGGSRPSVSMPTLPGADFAASIVTGVQGFSNRVIGNVTNFTDGVTRVTNPVPVVKSSGYRGGGGGGGGHSCACACACAGCACACAGGGR